MSKPREDSEINSLVSHSRGFHQFISESNDITSDRHVNSSRTKKAREKLLKLTNDQFSELSTDVHDELVRRLGDLTSRDEFLLPELNFHPKRNIARKKLASLPSSRYKDLVTDMLYEIERRGLDIPKTSKGPELSPLKLESKENGNSDRPHKDHSQLGVQSGNVIPTKSMLSWSSDEEEEVPSIAKKSSWDNNDNNNTKEDSPKAHQFYKNLSNSPLDDKRFTKTDSDYSPINKKFSPTSTEFDYNRNPLLPPILHHNHKSQASISSKDREIEVLLEEGTKMDKIITSHENTIESLNANNIKLKDQLNELRNNLNEFQNSDEQQKSEISKLQQDLSSQRSINNKQDTSNELQQEITKLKFTIKNLESEKSSNQNAYIQLRDENDKGNKEYQLILVDFKVLQEKYNTVLLNEEELKNEIVEDRKSTNNKLKNLQKENSALRQELESEKNKLTLTLNNNLNNSTSIHEIENIQKRLDKVDSRSINNNDETIEGLKLQILDWQKKYQDVRSETLKQSVSSEMNTLKPVDLSEKAMEKFVDPAGLISLQSIVELNSLISSFLLIINDEHLSTDLLFQTITKITIVAGNISNQGESINNGEYSALIKASTSHAITSTRFYAVHGKTLPKLVVETAISEIAFSVCNLVGAAKASKITATNPETFSVKSSGHENVLMAPNRPLRMAKKDGQSPIITTKRENPFTTNFSLSPNLIGKPNFAGNNNKSSPSVAKSNRFEDALLDADTSDDLKSNTSAIGTGSAIATGTGIGIGISKNIEKAIEPSSHSTPKKSSISQLRDKFNAESSPETTSSPPLTRGIASNSKGNILSRVKQLEESLNNSTPNASPIISPGLLSTKIVEKFENKFKSPEITKINEIDIRKELENEKDSNSITSNYSDQDSIDDEDDLNHVSNDFHDSKGNGFKLVNLGRDLSESKGKNFSLVNVSNDTSESNSKKFKPVGSSNESNGSNGMAIKLLDKIDTSQELHKLPSRPITGDDAAAQTPKAQVTSDFARPNGNFEDNGMPSPLQESKRNERATEFDVKKFDIADPDNSLGELLLYLEHQTVEVISTIQTLLSSIKTPDSTTGVLKDGAKAIGEVVGQMFDATSVSMAQTRNVQLREHGRWVVQSLADCGRRMDMLCTNDKSDDEDYADKHFKQRLAGIAFDIAKCTKELVKTVEEASIKEEIAVLDARLNIRAS